jgi:DNA helicase-2/ATP-dependent DNA helicase PcrA
LLRNLIDRLLRGLRAGSTATHHIGPAIRVGRSRNRPLTAEDIAKSAATSAYKAGDRVFHKTFGAGNVVQVEGDRLTIAFDKGGQKKVVDSFVEKA